MTGKKGRRSYGEGSIYQRKSDGLWCASIDLGFIAGRRVRPTAYGKTEWLPEFLQIKIEEEKSPSTIDRYRVAIDTHLIPGLGAIKLEDLTARRLHLFFKGYKGRAKPASIIKIHAVLRSALTTAMTYDLITRNIAKSVKPATLGRDERRALTPVEAKTFLKAIASHRLASVFLLAISTGMRRSELLGLHWADVDLGKKVLYVRTKLLRSTQGLTFGPTKTHRSQRALPLPAIAVPALESQQIVQAKERLAAGDAWVEHDLVFANTLGKPTEPRYVNRIFEKFRQLVGLDWLNLNDLRHAFATYLFDQDENARTVMELLGHSTIKLTNDTYGHVLSKRAHEAAKSIDWALGEEKKPLGYTVGYRKSKIKTRSYWWRRGESNP